MKKHIISLLLLCMFVLTLLAGCGGSAGSSVAGGGASNGSAANADGGAADPGEGWNQSSADTAESQPPPPLRQRCETPRSSLPATWICKARISTTRTLSCVS